MNLTTLILMVGSLSLLGNVIILIFLLTDVQKLHNISVMQKRILANIYSTISGIAVEDILQEDRQEVFEPIEDINDVGARME